jgi:hypothetical protein
MVQGMARFWLTLAAIAAAASPALAQRSSDPFSALVGRRERVEARETALPVDRYLIATDDRVFLFQAGAREGRLKFLCGDRDLRMDCRIDSVVPAEEIYVVEPTRAPRGDVVWRDPSGSARLRIAAYGGATVQWPGDDGEHAAARSYGEDPALTLEAADLETADRRARRATALVSALIGSPVLFEIENPPPGDASVLADAIARAAKAIAFVGDDATGARVLSQRIREVLFEAGEAKSLSIAGDRLIVVYAPGLELLGRPSSAEIERFLESSL